MNPSPYSPPFNSAHGRARIVKILLAIGAVVTGMSLLTETLSLAFPPLTEEQELGDNPGGAIILLLVFLIAVLELIIYLTTVVFFLMWLYRAYENLRVFSRGRPLDSSSGWAVGSFFIPFVNLVVPYRAVREVWQKSGLLEDAMFSEPSPPASFPIWWTFWLLSSFVSNISMRLTFNESVSPSNATIVSIIASALTIIAAVFAYLVVDAIDKKQEDTSGKLGFGKFPVPPPPPTNLSMSGVAPNAYSE